jgi:hypothetical protein
MQALDLSKAHMHKRVVEVAERALVVELDADNAKLLMELKQARLALAEVDAAQNSLCASQEKMELECVELRTTVDALKGVNAQLAVDHEAEVVAANKKYLRLPHWSPQKPSRASQ